MSAFDPKAVVTTMAPMLGLTIRPEWEGGVAAHLAVAQKLAEALIALDLPDEAEPAPVWQP